VRLACDVDQATAAQLDAIATLHQTNRSEVIRAAVRLALDLQREAS
jgi:metal-responsive CopG/Arc/MetJ family transcriptional regulator